MIKSCLIVLASRLAALIIMAALLSANWQSSLARAQNPDESQQPKVHQLLDLLGDQDVQKWLNSQKAVASEKSAGAVPELELSFSAAFARIRDHISEVIAAIPTLPEEFARTALVIAADRGDHKTGWVILLLAVFIAAGIFAEWLFWYVSSPWRNRIVMLRPETVRDRLLGILSRFVWNTCRILAFVAGSIGAFLAFDWPPLIKEVVAGYLFATAIVRLTHVILVFLFSPPDSSRPGDSASFRVLPVTDEFATYWTRRLSYVVGWFAFGWITVRLLALLNFPRPSYQLVGYGLGIVLLILGVEAVWRRPRSQAVARSWSSERARSWLLSVYFVGLWLFWVASAMRLFWLAVAVVALPGAAVFARRAVSHLLRPPDSVSGGRASILSGVLERLAFFLVVLLAILLLANAWNIDLTQITAKDTFGVRAVRGIFSAVVIALVANLAWHIVQTLIDRKLSESQTPAVEPDSELARRKARIQTLLPILRNVTFIVVTVVTVLMVLSSLGIQVGPLIAGAGVVGVAVGFGAQTVVKDIISGMFYLLDDAFRIGEYIESPNYRGTVESFSIRSIKLRHHRGAIYIVPFSELGSVQNMSRDWVIEKIVLTVTYDSDVEKARKIVKKIGQELAEDPEFKAGTIEPLKMQGIDTFGDSGMVLRMKLKTRPGEQFGVKRRALMMIKKAFDENGIKLAVPTVQVAGGNAEVAGAAQHVIAMQTAAKLKAAQ